MEQLRNNHLLKFVETKYLSFACRVFVSLFWPKLAHSIKDVFLHKGCCKKRKLVEKHFLLFERYRY
jgi:hypothetical protein